jgi:hypothetical protein
MASSALTPSNAHQGHDGKLRRVPRSSGRSKPQQRLLREKILRRFIFIAMLFCILNLQACASSVETFALGGIVGAVAGVSAIACAVGCK